MVPYDRHIPYNDLPSLPPSLECCFDQEIMRTTTNALNMKFYANGRIDDKFKDSATAESCFKRLRLNEIKLRDEN